MKCQGLPDQDCPFNASGEDVTATQGGLYLCLNCFNGRYGEDNTSLKQVATGGGINETNAQQKGSDPKADTQSVIIEPVLTYISFALQSGTVENIKKAVLGHFTDEQVLDAKNVLWEKGNNEIIGRKQRRMAGHKRTQREADCSDIIIALNKLDEAGVMPIFVIDYLSLGVIPRSHPEELNNISLIDRLNRLEMRITQVQSIADNTAAENLNLKDRLTIIENRTPKYSEIAAGSVKQSTNAIPPTNHSITTTMRDSQYVHPANQSSNAGRGRGRGRGRGFGAGQGFGQKRDVSNDSRTTNRSESAHSQMSRAGSVVSSESQGFEVPKYWLKKENKKKKHTIIMGRGSGQSGGLKGAPEPSRDLFIFRVDKSTLEADITNHLANHSVTIQTLECVSHQNAKYKSFKLSVPKSEYDKLFDENLWPEGIMIRKYVPPRANKSSEPWH
jgi:hypothetical protein